MNPTADYQTIHEGAAIGAITPRQALAIAGADRASYLHGMLSNDIQALAPGTGCYASWLTAQGRMLTDMHVLQSESMILLDVPAGTAEATLQRLDQFLFSEDVQLGSLAESLAIVSLHGLGAPAVIARALPPLDGVAEWPAYRNARADLLGEPVVVARFDQLGVPGIHLYFARDAEPRVVAALQAAGAEPVGAEAIEAARIEAAYPIFGVDMTEDTIPLEANLLDRAISTTKGCYVGQEVIIRVLHRGGGRVVRRLVQLRIEGGVAPAHGEKLKAGDREIGWITSAAISPNQGAIALAYLHRDFLASGTTVQVASDPPLTGVVV